MIYTVGHKVDYDRYFSEMHPNVPKKSGRDSKTHLNTTGGSVWETYDNARAACPKDYDVYGVNADWIKDTIKGKTAGLSHDLLKTSDMVQLTKQESFYQFACDLIIEDNEAPKYGCLMAMISPELSAQFVEWSFDHITPDEVVPENGKTGYEDEPHCTIAYGFHEDVSTSEVFNMIKTYGPISLTLGKISKFKQEDLDVLKIDVESQDLQDLNALLMNKFTSEDRYTTKFPEYHPHITLAYCKKGAGEDLDVDTFEGFEMEIDILVYSHPGAENKQALILK